MAACRLAQLIEECQLARDVDAMIDTALSMAECESGGVDGASDGITMPVAGRQGVGADVSDEILRLDASAASARAACGSAPPELLAQGWRFLLQAALGGHEASMIRFVTDLPRSPSQPAEDAAALAAWHRHAPVLLDELLQRHVPRALPVAYRAAQGFPTAGDQVLQARDPAAVMRLGSALARVLGDDAALDADLAVLEGELTPRQRRRARDDGERLAQAFLASAAHDAVPDEACEAGWPASSLNSATARLRTE